MEDAMITERQIEKRKREIAEENRRASIKAKREELKKARCEIVELLAQGRLQHAVDIAERAGILFKVPRKYLLARADELRNSFQVEVLEFAAKVYEHFHVDNKLYAVRKLIEEIEERRSSREMVEGMTR